MDTRVHLRFTFNSPEPNWVIRVYEDGTVDAAQTDGLGISEGFTGADALVYALKHIELVKAEIFMAMTTVAVQLLAQDWESSGDSERWLATTGTDTLAEIQATCYRNRGSIERGSLVENFWQAVTAELENR